MPEGHRLASRLSKESGSSGECCRGSAVQAASSWIQASRHLASWKNVLDHKWLVFWEVRKLGNEHMCKPTEGLYSPILRWLVLCPERPAGTWCQLVVSLSCGSDFFKGWDSSLWKLVSLNLVLQFVDVVHLFLWPRTWYAGLHLHGLPGFSEIPKNTQVPALHS